MTEPTLSKLDGLLDELIAQYKDMPGATLPLLHAVQDGLGHIPPAAVPRIAQALNLSRAEVHGVVSFYHHFRSRPPGARVVQLCRAEACQSMGGQALWEHACQSLGLDGQAGAHGATTADQAVTLQPVYCLGLCACAPAMAIDGQVHGRVQAADFERLLGRPQETV